MRGADGDSCGVSAQRQRRHNATSRRTHLCTQSTSPAKHGHPQCEFSSKLTCETTRCMSHPLLPLLPPLHHSFPPLHHSFHHFTKITLNSNPKPFLHHFTIPYTVTPLANPNPNLSIHHFTIPYNMTSFLTPFHHSFYDFTTPFRHYTTRAHLHPALKLTISRAPSAESQSSSDVGVTLTTSPTLTRDTRCSTRQD